MADRITLPETSSKDLKINKTNVLQSPDVDEKIKTDIIEKKEKDKNVVKSAQPTSKTVEDITSLPDDNMPDEADAEDYVPGDAIVSDIEIEQTNEKIENATSGEEEEFILDLNDSENTNLNEDQLYAMQYDNNYGYFYNTDTVSQYSKSNTTSNINPNEVITVSGDFAHPTNRKGYITSDFGFRIINIGGIHWEFHGGIDVGGLREGVDKIYAIADGVVYESVVGARNYKSYPNSKCPSPYNNGNCVRIRFSHNGRNYEAIYMHMTDNFMKVGDKVRKGQVIGSVGNTGYSGGVHLHFEIRCIGIKNYYRTNYKQGYKGRNTDVLASGYYGVRKVSSTDIENNTGDFVPPKTFFSY